MLYICIRYFQKGSEPQMNNTTAVIEMDLTEENIASDGSVSATHNSGFADISEINTPHNPYNPFMTLEHNICVLDGSLEVYDPQNVSFSYFSSTLSADDCSSSEKITITFNNTHSLAGLVFDFGTHGFLGEITLTYLNSTTVLNANDFYPTGSVYTEKYGCEGFNKIEIEFTETRFPRMFMRLQSIEYGFKYNWKSENIISCQINEEVNPISSKVPINTCQVTIYDKSNEFNILNPKGVYKYLQEKQKFHIYGIINGSQEQMGVYFLDTWDASKPYEITFNLISQLGVLDRTTYYDGGIIGFDDSYSAYDCLQNILTDAGLTETTDFTISNDLKNINVIGLIPICTHKEAIQNVAFTANACIDDTRDGIIKIYNQNQDTRYNISPNMIFDSVKVNKNEIVTGIDITLHYFDVSTSSSDFKEIFNGYIEANQTIRIMSTEPIFGARYSKDGGSFVNLDPNPPSSEYTIGKFYFDFTAGSSGIYLFQVSPFKPSKTIYRKRIQSPIPNSKENILKIENATLLYDDGYYWSEPVTGNVSGFSDNLINFYRNNNLKIEFEYLFDGNIKTGQKGSIFTEFNQYCIGSISNQRINLGSGFLSSAVMTANNGNLTDYYFATDGTAGGTTTGQYELYGLEDEENILI